MRAFRDVALCINFYCGTLLLFAVIAKDALFELGSSRSYDNFSSIELFEVLVFRVEVLLVLSGEN